MLKLWFESMQVLSLEYLSSISGECVSVATKEAKARLEKVVAGLGPFGRKVDLEFVSMRKHEISNIEFKPIKSQATKLGQVQHLKNIRLNRCIMVKHWEATGRRSPILFWSICGNDA